MKKALILPVLSVLGGLAGFALRNWQLSAAVDPVSGILLPTHPATLGLLLLSAGAALLALLLPRRVRCPEGVENVFFCPHSLYMALTAAAGLLLLGTGGLGLLGTLRSYQDLMAVAAVAQERAPFPVLDALCGGLCLPAGVGILVFGRGNYRGTDSPGRLLSSLAPGYLALLLLIRFYVGHSSDPLLLRYAWPLLGWIATLLALYCVASCGYRGPAPRTTLFFSGAAVFLQLTSLADRPERFQVLCALALTLYLLAQSTALAQNCAAARMPPGARENDAQTQANHE